ncbi:MAG: ABC transporter permease [Polyangiaceae bacterium]
MGRYLVVRLSSLAATLFVLSLVVFALGSMIPGDPATALLGPYATAERVAALQRDLGLGGSLPERYLVWLAHVLRGDLGHSYALDLPVREAILERLRPTLMLGGSALVFAICLGLLLGTLSARHEGTPLGRALDVLSLSGISVPTFVLALFVMLLLAAWGQLYPVSGMHAPPPAPRTLRDVAAHVVLPALSLGLVSASVIARMTREYTREARQADFVRVLQAKGLSQTEVLYRHVFRVVVAKLAPVLGLQAGFVLGGAVYVETIFQWPGLGRLLVDAVLKRDLLLTQGVTLTLATAYVLTTLAADLGQRALDPRVDA